MANDYVQRLEFTVEGQSPDTFSVFRMTGREAISELFRFEIMAVADDCDLDFDNLSGKNATLTISRLGQVRRIHGMVEEIELQDVTPQGQFVYRVLLVPRLRRLAMTRQNQIHGTTNPVSIADVLNHELTASVLKGAPAASVAGRLGLEDFEVRLTHSYPRRDYIVQHDESDLAFVSRLCEHYGVFYYFAHDSGRDVVVFGDSRVAFPTIGGPADLPYRSVSGLANASRAAVFRFTGRTALVPSKVCLRDYNYRIPNLALEVDETVDPKGHGVVVEYGAHFRTPQEGRDLARVRAQELASRKQVFSGASDCVHMGAGAVFDLSDHFCERFNGGYLLTWVEHEATQPLPGIAEFSGPDHETSYRNRFECLPKSVEFRPARVTPKPRMTGLTNAVVDASGSGQRAEIDASGRYKIRQQFDQRGEAAGQASRYMRKAEPYGGANTGMHFPLLKGTEVILACVNGDPDRPIIVGAMQNEQYPSVVNARSNTKNRMRTTSGTLFEMDDGAAGDTGGGSGAGSGAALAPQRALEGAAPEPGTPAAPNPAGPDKAPASRRLVEQRAEAEIQTTGDSSAAYARLQITSGIETYWRLGSQPDDTIEDSITPDMSDMDGGSYAGGGGFFEYTVSDRTSLVKGSSYTQVDTNRLDYVAGDRRQSAANHNIVSKGKYETIAKSVVIQAKNSTLTDNSSPTTSAANGDMMLKADGDLNSEVGGNFNQNIAGDGIAHIQGTDVSQTWGSTADFMMGSAVSMTLGSEISLNLSSAIGIAAGIKFDLFLGIAYDFRIGPSFELTTSPAIELSAVSDIKTKSSEIQTVAAKVGAAPLKLLTSAAEVTSQGVTAMTEGIKAKLSSLNVTV